VALGGAQQKFQHRIELRSATVLEACARGDESVYAHSFPSASSPLPAWFYIQSALYSNALHATLLCTDAQLQFERAEQVAFRELCARTTELHFDEFDTQLEQIREDVVPTQSLTVGDFVITKHSNLAGAHVVFHLVDSQPDHPPTIPKDASHPLLRGLEMILRVAIQYDITRFTVPLLLTERVLVDPDPNAYLAHAKLVVRVVKSLLAHASDGLPLATIQFLAAPSLSDEQFLSVQKLLLSEFQDSIVRR